MLLRGLAGLKKGGARGDPAEAWSAVARGAVRVSSVSLSGKQVTLTYVEPGTWFGDIALFDGLPRTHDADAHGPTTLLVVRKADFKELLAQHLIRPSKVELFVMNADGSNQHRITFGQGRYANPVWSPRGDLVAFTKQNAGRFYIGVMRTDGSEERLLTSSYLDEGPTWAPNGRIIQFFRTERGGGQASLWQVDLTGRNERRLPTPADASDPAWGPIRP